MILISKHIYLIHRCDSNWYCCIATYIHLHVYIYANNQKSTGNERTSMNERIHFFIKIYLSHFIKMYLSHFILEPSGHLVIFLSNVHLLPLFFRLFTQVYLLIDDSVEGQYITIIPFLFFKIPHVDIFFTSVSIPLTHTFYKKCSRTTRAKVQKEITWTTTK